MSASDSRHGRGVVGSKRGIIRAGWQQKAVVVFQAEDDIRDIGVTGVQTCALPICPGVIILKSVKERTSVIKKNPGASLIDLGDGVACLEFHSKMNSIGGDTLQMVKYSLSERSEERRVGNECRSRRAPYH